MKHSVKIAGLVVLLTSCRSHTPDTPISGSPIRIQPLVTRVTGTYFDSDDRIGLTVTTGTETYADNRELTYDGESFSSTELLWYNDTTQPCALSAYYPYDPAGTPTLFTVPADQSAAGYTAADLLASRRSNVLPSITPTEMLFDHLMSKLRLEIDNRSDGEVTSVTLEGLLPTARIDWEELRAAADETSARIALIPHPTSEELYEAIAVPQSAALAVRIETNDGKTHRHTLTATTLQGGKIYTVKLTLTNIDIRCTLSGEINDWEPGETIPEETTPEETETITYGGETYRTVTLPDGSCWFAENLRYNPGPASDLTTGASSARYPGEGLTDTDSVTRYGLLYDGDTAQTVCPPDWTLPEESDFERLREVLPDDFLTPTPALWSTGGYKQYADRSNLWSRTSAGDGYRLLTVDYATTPPDLYVESKSRAIAAPVRCMKVR